MIRKRLFLNGVEYTSLLLKDGLGPVKFESQDERGTLTIGSLRFRLSNMHGALDGLFDVQSRLSVKLLINDVNAFEGLVDTDGLVFDRHTRVVEAEAVSIDAEYVEKFKKTTFSMLPYAANRFLPIRTLIGGQVFRYFFDLQQLLSNIVIFFSIGRDFVLPQNVVCGGTIGNSAAMKPDMTIYDFLTDVCAMFNMVWTVQPPIPTLVVKLKKDLLNQRVVIPPPDLPIIRESLHVFSRREGFDVVTIQYPNLPSRPAQNDPRRALISRGGKALRTHDISVRNLKYPAGDVATPDGIAVIAENDVGGDYIMRSLGSSAEQQYAIPAIDLLFAHYRFELFALSEQEAAYDLIKDSSSLIPLLPLFYTHWQTVYPNPWPFFHHHFVRSAEMDLTEQTLRVTTIGYSNLSA